ncbi:DUF305 domain-containing protein [Hymenobacter lucidus]|uniref:DUF305 domain-containing protein n=1 Tax=Hymenobacter lucidus TaxID=2880930 RepID=A0ABS8AYX5_9BACT|nr:DUF305 domain-containing protein [Hymenobacter lucidus]MCB2410988.1 DUF305 domain-containing protein [Hymenobacter lucidus]
MLLRSVVGLVVLLLLGACRESVQDIPAHTADTHQQAPEQSGGLLAPPTGQQAQQRLRSVARTGNVDHDIASLLLEHLRGARQLAAAELATGRAPVLRALADTLRRAWQRESQNLGRLAVRTHNQESEEHTRHYQEFNRDVQAALDSAVYSTHAASADPDIEFAAALSIQLRTGLRLVQEAIAHGSDPSLIALAHRLHHDQLHYLRRVQSWSSTHLPPAKL